VGVAAGTVALWLSPLNDVGSPLVDASGNGHTLIEAGAVPTVTGAGIAKGAVRGWTNVWNALLPQRNSQDGAKRGHHVPR
jgi:hypothetical protein